MAARTCVHQDGTQFTVFGLQYKSSASHTSTSAALMAYKGKYMSYSYSVLAPNVYIVVSSVEVSRNEKEQSD